MTLHDIEIDEAKLAEFCRAKGITELLFFGSIVRDDFRQESDVDVIVDFLPERIPGLIRFAGIELDLTRLFGREVHLHTREMIHPYLRSRIEQESKVAYDEQGQGLIHQ